MFRLISNLIQSVRPDGEHTGNRAGDYSYHQPPVQQQYYPTHVTDRGYYVAPVQRRSCCQRKQERRALKQERKVVRHMHKAERIAERQARRSARCCGGGRRNTDTTGLGLAATTAAVPPRTPQHQETSGLAAEYYDSNPVGVGARSEPTQYSGQHSRENEWGLDGEVSPPSYEEVEKKDKS